MAVDAVVDVGGPHRRLEKEDLVREHMHGDKKQGDHVGRGLDDAVDGVEGEAGEGGEGMLLIVHMMHAVERLIKGLDLVQRAVRPVHPKLNHQHVGPEVHKVTRKPHLGDLRVGEGPSALHHGLGDGREGRVEGDGLGGHPNLLPHIGLGRVLARGVEIIHVPPVDVRRPQPPDAVVEEHPRHEVPQPRHQHRAQNRATQRPYSIPRLLGHPEEDQVVLPLGLDLEPLEAPRLRRRVHARA
mmetsp:Transcript_66316/g.209635  ORF Transcript_66316/g.209635 Transcript_66316/m.209635 type:complete len:241 (-) Transcript_66316:279-1001(-)